MKKSSAFLALSFAVSSLTTTSASHAQTPHILGVWQLNSEASDVPEFIPRQSETRSYMLRDDGYLVVLVVRYASTGADFIQLAARSDRNEYPECRSQSLAEFAINQMATPITYSETVFDDYSVNVIGRFDGRIANQAHDESPKTAKQ